MDINSDEIHILLKDICEYLKRKRENVTLSAEDRKLAEDLIERSKKQLQKIVLVKSKDEYECYEAIDSKPDPPKIQKMGNPKIEHERYIDMTRKPVPDDAPPLPVKNPKLQLKQTPSAEGKCPYMGLPAKNLSQEIKRGTLSIRRKVFNIIDRSSKVFGAVHENWLLMYWSNKDDKPFCALDLKQYEAKEEVSDPTLTELDITRDLKKNDVKLSASFKVLQSNSSEKKCYNFVATTHKDMLQWVVNINRIHDKAVRGDKYVEEQVYEICEEPSPELEEENIYNEIEIKFAQKNTSEIVKPSVVPPPPPDENQASSSSLSDSEDNIYQELVVSGKKSSIKSDVASFDFSDEEGEEQTYYELASDVCERKLIKELKLTYPQNDDNTNIDIPPPAINNLTTDKEFLTTTNIDIPSPAIILNNVTTNKDFSSTFSNRPVSPEDKLNQFTYTKPKVPARTPIKQTKVNASPKPNKFMSWNSIRKHTPMIISTSKTPEKSISKEVTTPNTNMEVDLINKHPSELNGKTRDSPKSIQASSIVKIIRQRLSTGEYQFRNLETFSRNSKLETFQASPTKEGGPIDFDFLDSPAAEIDSSLTPIIEAMDSNKGNKQVDDDGKPMVLLKANLEDEVSSKKFKKSPIIPSKPKKVNKKLQF